MLYCVLSFLAGVATTLVVQRWAPTILMQLLMWRLRGATVTGSPTVTSSVLAKVKKYKEYKSVSINKGGYLTYDELSKGSESYKQWVKTYVLTKEEDAELIKVCSDFFVDEDFDIAHDVASGLGLKLTSLKEYHGEYDPRVIQCSVSDNNIITQIVSVCYKMKAF